MPRLLLLVPAHTYRAGDFLLAAVNMGLDVVIGSDGALPLGTGPVVRIDLKDPRASVNRLLAQGVRFDAVVGADSEMLVLAAMVAERLGLRHNPLDAVIATLDKAKQRRLWAALDIPQPNFQVVPARGTLRAAMRAASDVGYPCVVKAVSLSGSRGVLRADDGRGAALAAERIRRLLIRMGRPDEPLLVEKYVSGCEVSLDGLMVDGKLTVIAVFDKPDTPAGPTFEETLLVTPTRLPRRVLSLVSSLTERAATGLGLRYGPIHAELRIDAGESDPRPTMIELAARSIGGMCSRALRFLNRVSLEEMVLANALGYRVSKPRVLRPAGVLMLPVEGSGVLRGVEGTQEAAALPGITGLSITIPAGDVVESLPEGDRYLGFIFAERDTPELVAEALRTARRRLNVIIEPVLRKEPEHGLPKHTRRQKASVTLQKV